LLQLSMIEEAPTGDFPLLDSLIEPEDLKGYTL